LDAGLRRSKALTDAASRTIKAESSIEVITVEVSTCRAANGVPRPE